MSRNTFRLLIAATLSGLGFISTLLWYRLSTQEDKITQNAKPIARLTFSENEVQRKPLQKLIWQPVSKNEILHIGEAVRTAAKSQAVIEFLNSTTRIELEPDSAIILEENSGQVALQFIKGNLFVQSDKSSGIGETQITLKTGDNEIALNKSELSLTKTQSGELDLQVLKGQADIISGGQKITLEQGKSLNRETFKLIQPSADTPIFINSEGEATIDFTWAPLDASYEVTLETGSSRKKLKPSISNSVRGDIGKLNGQVKSGKIFYRLVARSADPEKPTLETLIYRNQVIAKLPPKLISPQKDEEIILSSEQKKVDFNWASATPFELMTIEIYQIPKNKKLADLNLKQLKPIFTKNMEKKKNLQLDFKSSGEFAWRVIGKIKTLDRIPAEELSSELTPFTARLTQGLEAPLLVAPIASAEIALENLTETGLTFNWSAVKGAKRYKFVFKKKNQKNPAQEIETELTQVSLNELELGSFIWSVSSIDERGRYSNSSEERSLNLLQLPMIEWVQKEDPINHEYVTVKPSVSIDWYPVKLAFDEYRIKINLKDSTQPWSETKVSKTNGIKTELPQNGEYFIEVEAIKNNQIVAKAKNKIWSVSAAPLLPAPEFAATLPESLVASNRGLAYLKWNQVPGASRTIVILKDEKKEVKREIASLTAGTEIKNLMPGQYQVILRSMDQYGRLGPEGMARPLLVPEVSDVRAPQLKEVKIK